MLSALRPRTRFAIAALAGLVLLLQTLAPLVTTAPELRAPVAPLVLGLLAALPLLIWLLPYWLPDIDIRPRTLKRLLMVAALGLPFSLLLMWLYPENEPTPHAVG